MVASSLEKLQETYDLAITWRSFQLRPAGSPPIPPEYRARIEASRPSFAERVRQELGLTLNPGPFEIDSRPSLILEKFFEAQGKGEEGHKAIQDAYWLQGRAIDKPEVLKEIVQEVGLPTDHIDDVLHSAVYDAEVSADIDLAQQYGLDAVPALVFNNQYLVSGAQPYDVLRKVVEKVQAEEA